MSDSLNSPRIAVLVDADNVESHQIEFAIQQASQHGTVTLRRAFGRMTSIRGRQKVLSSLGFAVEVALPASRATKDTSDLLIAQYAVRLAERGAVDLVALVSSDSDFAAIARGVAESGVPALGFGRADTPAALRESCISFTPFPDSSGAPKKTRRGGGSSRTALTDRDTDKLRRVLASTIGKSGRARAQTVGTQINRAFDGEYKKHFGVSTLSELIERVEGYEIQGNGTDAEVVRKKA